MNASQDHILIVEDDDLNRTMLHELLQSCGYNVTTAESGTTALQCIRETPVDAVIVDSRLTDMTGDVLTRQLRANTATSSAIIIGLSGDTSDDNRSRCLDAGMDAFCTKPIDIQQFADLVAAHLKRAELSGCSA